MGILDKIYTAERADENAVSDNPVFMRQLFAYTQAAEEVSGCILEIGCGEGYGIKWLSPKASRYVAIDKHIPLNQQNFAHVEFINMEVPWLTEMENDQFDVVICFQLIEHIQDDQTLLKEIYRVLKPGGKLLLTTPNQSMTLSRNPYHIREYNTNQFRELLSRYFDSEKIFFGGVFGDATVMEYHERNRKSVERFRKFDILGLEKHLPASWFKIPYDILNRMNRNVLKNNNDALVSGISTANFFIKEMDGGQLDYYCRAVK
ncbi:MAG: methyltransferase domain-containing protein [Saprospiraceae bacterium]|nr:methyltransferase domain-containing protein [Saprospiraceae bacterium]